MVSKVHCDAPKRIAIIGGGISGMATSWGLRGEESEVHIFEAGSQLGGHANSVPFRGNGRTVSIDTAFTVFSEETYPKFSAFLKALKVPTIPTDMSFGVSEDDGVFEWGSTSIWSFINSPWQLFRPWFWRLVFDIIRFNFCATDLLSEDCHDPHGTARLKDSLIGNEDKSLLADQGERLESIGQYLARKHYSEQFKRYYIVPMVAAPWCIDPEELANEFPAAFLIHFMAQHHLLSTATKTLRWRSFKNGSRSYINAFQKSLPPHHHLHLDTPVHQVTRQHDGRVLVTTADGVNQTFDHVVLSLHANQALRILGDGATMLERDILGNFKTNKNVCVVHSDTSLLPKNPRAHVSWNCMMQSQRFRSGTTATDIISPRIQPKHPYASSGFVEKTTITFDMNKLQAIPNPGELGSPGRVLVSMNPLKPPRSPQSSHYYETPIFTSDSVLAAKRLHLINGVSSISFAGAWMGYGFHEDGFAAGMKVAESIIRRGSGANDSRYGNILADWQPQQSRGVAVFKNVIYTVQSLIDGSEQLSSMLERSVRL